MAVRPALSGGVETDVLVHPARTEQCGVQKILVRGRAHHQHPLAAVHAVDEFEQGGEVAFCQIRLVVAVAHKSVEFVDEYDGRSDLFCAGEHRFQFADALVIGKLRAVHVEEGSVKFGRQHLGKKRLAYAGFS